MQLQILVLACERLDREGLGKRRCGSACWPPRKQCSETDDKDERDGAHDARVDDVACDAKPSAAEADHEALDRASAPIVSNLLPPLGYLR